MNMSNPLFLKFKSSNEINDFKQSLLLQTGQYAEDFEIYTQADLDQAVEECKVVFQNGICILFI